MGEQPSEQQKTLKGTANLPAEGVPQPPGSVGDTAAVPAVATPKKHSWVMWVLFIAPIVLFIGVMLAFYMPQMLAKPQYDFVYMSCSGSCKGEFTVLKDGKVTKAPLTADNLGRHFKDDDEEAPRFFRYSQQRQESDEISVEEVNALQLNTNRRSKDGYALVRHEGADSGILFFYTHNDARSGWALQKGRVYKPVYLQGDVNSYYARDIQFVGWVAHNE